MRTKHRTQSTQRPTKVAGKPATESRRCSSGSSLYSEDSVGQSVLVLVVDDYERQIQKFYSLSKSRAVEAAKKAGVLTPSGRLSRSYM